MFEVITINANCVCYLTHKTAEKVRAEQREDEERMRLFKALDRAAANEDWDFYSDLYKDLYGVRPRW